MAAHPVRRPRRLSAAAGRAAAAGRFPHHSGFRQYPGASPDTMASSVAQPLETQFAQIPGLSQMTSTSTLGTDRDHRAVRPRPQHRRRRRDVQAAINAGSGAVAEGSAEPADLSQGQSGRRADPDAGRAPRHAAADRGRRLRRDHPRPADQPDFRRRPGVHRRPAEAGDPHPGRSGAKLVANGPRSRTCARRSSSPRWPSPRAAIDGARSSFTIYTNDQLTRPKNWNDVIVAYRNGAPLRVRDIGQAVDRPAGHESGRLGRTASAASSWSSSSSPAPTSSTRRRRSRRAAAAQGLDPALDHMSHCRPHADHPRLGRRRAVHADAHHRLVVMVIFLFLRNFWATIIPSVTVPLALLGTFALMYLPATASTTCR
jgi:hydrophobic/amphiphilic exporter-1 (mainly G- bacteria), HAE1 family